MKTVILIIAAALLSVLSFSCEENFSPKTDYTEKYILYCIVNTDSSVQTAVLQRSYNVEGYDPYLNTIDPSIIGADIRIRQGDNVFFFHDTSIVRSDTSRYNTPVNFYYTDNFFVQGNDSIEILATLPNGIKLSGVTNLTVGIEFSTASDHIIPSEENDFFTFIWNAEGANRWYLPKFTFYYLKNGVRFGKEVPSEYIFENGSWIATYPEITISNIIRFKHAALDSAFAQISSGDPDKGSYRILGGVLTLLVFNESLSNYYSTTNGFLDDFTIRLDEADYTNITGGFGILGTYKRQLSGARFTDSYIESFGYTPGLP